MKLQQISFRKNRYERPNQSKICGLSTQGRPCSLGPNAAGDCPGRTECIPFQKGDRWVCTRPVSAGGRCEKGPTTNGECPHRTKCVPQDSPRARRGQFVFGIVTLLALTLVLIGMFPIGLSFFSPGELSSKHSNLGEENCRSCHSEDIENITHWLGSAFQPMAVKDSNMKCMSCHVLSADADIVHSLPLSSLQAIRQEKLGESTSLLNDDVQLSFREKSSACFSCHREHQGMEASLISVSDAQCDTCHVQAHAPFTLAHAEFDQDFPASGWPVKFRHRLHAEKYYKNDRVKVAPPESCSDCHIADEAGIQMKNKPFEVTCGQGGCHDGDIAGDKAIWAGIPFVTLPIKDEDDFDAARRNKFWPDEFDEEIHKLSPFTLLLLDKDTQLFATLKQIVDDSLEEETGFAYLENINSTEMNHLRKRLGSRLETLASLSHEALLDELLNTLRYPLLDELSIEEREALLSGLPQQLLGIAAQRWMNGSGGALADSAHKLDGTGVNYGGWYIDDYSISYRPVGHGDEFLKTWVEIAPKLETAVRGTSDMLNDVLKGEDLVGRCARCHEMNTGDAGIVQWSSNSRRDQHSFTVFNHGVHLNLVDKDKGCFSCHTADSTDENPKDGEPGRFLQVEKSACMSCHTKETGRDNCLTCHQYHVGGFGVVEQTGKLN